MNLKKMNFKKKIINAKELLSQIKIINEFIEIIAKISRNLGIEGDKTDINI